MTIEYLDRGPLDRTALAHRVAADIQPDSYVNLGIGQPTTVADHLDPAAGVILHTENGMLGMGRTARAGEVDPDLINAGKQPVTESPGCSYFDHAESFAIIRGGHLDVCVLGAFQVSASGDLANWHTGEPGAIPAVGGAMDLALGANAVFAMMTLFAKDGRAKLVPTCTFPLTARRCVNRIFTDWAVLDIVSTGVVVRETYGLSLRELRTRLDVELGAE